jgi:serpin B
MTSRGCRLPSVLAALLVLIGCSEELPEGPEASPAPGSLIASDKPRMTNPSAPAGDVAAVAAGNTDFGAALYRQTARPGENLFFSPYSLSQAFGMVYAGARGATEAQMGQALRFSLSQERLHPAMNALDLTLQDHASLPQEEKGTPPELRAVNATWGQQGYAFEPAFLDVLALHYGAGVRAVDFQREAEPLRSQINEWIEGQTNGRIQELLPAGVIKPDTRLVLTNALYFKGSWAATFDTRQTQSAAFHLLGGGEQTVQMMGLSASLPRMQGAGFEAFALPYVGRAFRMLVILPDSGRFEEVEARLSAEFLDGVRRELTNQYTALQFPKFQIETELPLVESLKGLGMVDAFTDNADLSGITLQERLAITDARHKAFISVDEAGTEAAAATGVVIGPVSLPESLVVDRPFLFLIEDVETKAVLFLGRVVKP